MLVAKDSGNHCDTFWFNSDATLGLHYSGSQAAENETLPHSHAEYEIRICLSVSLGLLSPFVVSVMGQTVEKQGIRPSATERPQRRLPPRPKKTIQLLLLDNILRRG